MRPNRMNTGVTGNAISGVIAAVIYAVIALLTGARGSGVLVVALIIGAVTFVLAFTIGRIISRSRRGPTS